MKHNSYQVFESLLKKESGLVITPEKTYLLESRILPIAKKHSLDGLDGVADALNSNRIMALKKEVIDAMTTNETSFFRDKRPFDNFKEYIIPHFLEENAGVKKIRIWSAACSSGQEPYSLAMILKEMGPKLAGWKIEIIATDLSDDILDTAKNATYTQFEVQRGLPIQFLVKYFEQAGEKWKVKPEIRNMITFKSLNLLDNFNLMGNFDIVFCRNVLIYFDVDTKRDILNKITQQMAKNGILLLGGAETVLGIYDGLRPVKGRHGLYSKPDSTHE